MPTTCATIRAKSKNDAVGQDRLRSRIHATAAAVGIAAGAAGCGDRFCPPDTLCASPTAPTTADAAGRGYSRDFYAALVFNAYDGASGRYGVAGQYGGVMSASRVRDDPHAVSVMLDLTETTRTCPYAEHRIVARSGGSISWRHWIEQDTGPTIEQVTGRRWTGRLHVAEEPGEAEAVTGLLDWIVVRLQRRPGCKTVGDGRWDNESPGRRCHGAESYVGGSWRGEADSTIFLDRYCRSAFSNERAFRHVWLHEALGHAMGFWHVPGGADVMGSSPWNKTRFTEREQRAMRDAYRAGRGDPRIGAHRTIAPHPRSMPPMRPVLIEH